MYEVRLRSKRVQRELEALQRTDHDRVVTKMLALAHEPRPHGCETLYDSIYRIRVGDVRVIYLVDEDKKRVEVGGIRRRSEKTYRGIDDLFR